MNIKRIVINFISKPKANILSSQTLYESLLGVLDLYELSKDSFWKEEADTISTLIMKHQLPNGGFDIGYNFTFGIGLRKSSKYEATTPEVLSIYALYRYGEAFGFTRVQESIDKGIDWILKNIIKTEDGLHVIPYAPHTHKKIHITNSISFTIGVLSYYMKYNPNDLFVKQVYQDMILFMKTELISDSIGDTGYWKYFYLGGSPEDLKYTNQKIDNYHIGQQLKYHCKAYSNYPNEENKEIIELVSNYLVTKIENNGFLKYREFDRSDSENLDLWGYSSVSKGLIEAYKITNNDKLIDKAKLIIDVCVSKGWNGDYFYPIIRVDGTVVDSHFYPRSDAWVFHSIAHYLVTLEFDNGLYEICKKDYQLIRKNNFKGLENHAVTLRKKIFSKIFPFIEKLVKNYRN